MSMPYKAIVVGIGGFGKHWCLHILPQAVREGLIEVVAAVDVNPDMFINAIEGLGLTEEQCYTDAKIAFSNHPAHFCVLITPPKYREQLVDLALSHNLHILSEKPISDTLASSLRIAEKVKRSGKKMGITMSRRYEQDKMTMLHEIRSGRHGTLDYIVLRHTCNLRVFGSWGKYRHEMSDPVLIESGMHRLDLMAELANAKCEMVFTEAWNPAWGEYAGNSQTLVTMRFENGVRGLFEAAYSNAAGINVFGREYIRTECRNATLILDKKKLQCLRYDSGKLEFPMENAIDVPFMQRKTWEHHWLIEQFVQWLENDVTMETSVEAVLQTAAIISAAVESGKTGKPVDVQSHLESNKTH